MATFRFLNRWHGLLKQELKAVADAMIELFHYYISGQASRISPAVRQITGKEPLSFEQYARDFASSFRQDAQAAG